MNKEQIIGDVKGFLSDTVPTTRHTQITVLAYVETYREPLLSLRVEAYKELCKKREQYRHPKDKEYTDFDRQTMLSAAVADVEAEYQLVKGLEDLVRERVELIKILLEAK